MQQSDMRVMGDRDVLAGGRREDGCAPAPSTIGISSQGHRFAKVESVASRTGLLFKLIDMAFIDIRLLRRVERPFMPYETVEVVSDAVDVAGDMCDDVIDTNITRYSLITMRHTRARHGRFTNADCRVRVMVNSA